MCGFVDSPGAPSFRALCERVSDGKARREESLAESRPACRMRENLANLASPHAHTFNAQVLRCTQDDRGEGLLDLDYALSGR
jgi:hypothetical protein